MLIKNRDLVSKRSTKRFLSALLSSVLVITLLQVAPPASATPVAAQALSVNLVPRLNDVDGLSVLLEESSLVGAISNETYHLDLDVRTPSCGRLEFVDKLGIAGVTDPNQQPVNWNLNEDYVELVGQASQLELALKNLKIVRASSPSGEVDCPISAIDAYFANVVGGILEPPPEGRANFYLNTTELFMNMYQVNEAPSPSSPRINLFSDGFEVEWNEYLGSAGYTPIGYTVRHRTFDGAVRGPWIYQSISGGDYKSMLVRGLVSQNGYEAQIAPSVRTCENEILHGMFANIPEVGTFETNGSETVPNEGFGQTTGQAVVSQCPTTLVDYKTDVEWGRFGWSGAGTGIENLKVYTSPSAEPEDVLGTGSMRAFWVPAISADPVTQGIEIKCENDVDDGVQFGSNLGSSTLLCSEFDLSEVQVGLTAQIRRDFAASDAWHQMIVKLKNNHTEEISGFIAYRIDLASGPETQIEMTSNGDLILQNTDSWFVTSDSLPSARPVSLHFFGELNGQEVSQDDASSGAGKFWIKKPFTVGAGLDQTQRFIDGFTDPGFNVVGNEAVIVAMKAADELEYQQWSGNNGSDSNILDQNIADAIDRDRDLPSLRLQFECRDFGRNLIYPVVVQNNGQPIGCDIGGSGYLDSEGGDGPSNYNALNAGLFPSTLQIQDKKEDWIRLFSSTFPNATPRLGWACDICTITSVGPQNQSQVQELADGLPLGFTTSVDEQSSLDSIRILPQGVVQLHESGDNNLANVKVIAAFNNTALGNEVIQGSWSELPEYDFFYWGRTMYQGRLAFVVTWVKIPTLDNGTPINASPTTMQLMLVSDHRSIELPDVIVNSDVDIIWNFDEIHSANAVTSPAQGADTPLFYSGIAAIGKEIPLISDAYIEGDETAVVGIGTTSCNSECVVNNLLENRLQSSVDGRYVLSYRTYEIIEPIITKYGISAPAAPRQVTVSRPSGNSAIVSWSKPLPWVLEMFSPPIGTEPVFGYRIEYAVNTRDENPYCADDWQDSLSCSTIFPSLQEVPLTEEDVSVFGSGATQRLSITIPELSEFENYTFRVFAVYVGLDFPESMDAENPNQPSDLMFYDEVRSSPATANELHDSELQIVTVATDPNPLAISAESIASQLAGELEVSNVTVNGSPYAYGQTAKSVANFTGGQNSVGIDEGIVITPLVDARTFQRGSGITATRSRGNYPSYFADPNHRTKYFESSNDFSEFLRMQESWTPSLADFSPVCRYEDCAVGTTVFQFDIAKPQDSKFLKFEYALAGLETTDMSGPSGNAEVYQYPDGFGLFIGGINQESSCALVPQVGNEAESQRFMSMGNALNARLATEVEFNSDLNAETVSAVMSCNFDTSGTASESITITMAIANANDEFLSTAVFIKSESIRFEPTSIDAVDVPAATQGQNYEELVFTSTGEVPANWFATGLPDGMIVSATGVLSGNPDEHGSFNFTLNALSGNGDVLASQFFTIVVNRNLDGNLVASDRFLQGDYVEVGIGGNGHFGSSGPAPVGYHPRDPGTDMSQSLLGRIGFVSDRDKDGWGVGKDDGDFFVPGEPFEAFSVEVGGVNYTNSNSITDIPRATDLYSEIADSVASTWVSEPMQNGLTVTQTSSVPRTGNRLDVSVTFENTSPNDIADIYYARQVDNDANRFACRDGFGGWSSLNAVESQASSGNGISLVSSVMSDSCDAIQAPDIANEPHSFLGIYSSDPRSVAAIQLEDFGAQRASDFVNGNDISGPDVYRVQTAIGSRGFDDSGIGMGFNVGTISSGDSKTITFSYVLSPNQISEIIDEEVSGLVAPEITSLFPNYSGVVGSPIDILASTWLSNTGGEIAYFSISPGLPTGLTMNSATGDISGTPSQSIPPTIFAITAHNLAGTSTAEISYSTIDQPVLEQYGSVLMAKWPGDSQDVSDYEFEVSSDEKATWTNTESVVNTGARPFSVEIINVTPGNTYELRVRKINSSVAGEWIYSAPLYFAVAGCSNLSAKVNVVVLSATVDELGIGTDPLAKDQEIVSGMCASQALNVSLFDGTVSNSAFPKGSAGAWTVALKGKNVLVLPQITGEGLSGTSLMSLEAQVVVTTWIEAGGTIIYTNSGGYVPDIEKHYDAGYVSMLVENQVPETSIRASWANRLLPGSLPTFSKPGLILSNGLYNSLNLYQDSAGSQSSQVIGLAKDRGWIFALSNDFAIESEGWNKVLRQIAFGSSMQFNYNENSPSNWTMSINEADQNWYVGPAGILYAESLELSAINVVRLGDIKNPSTVNCINTPNNPATITKTVKGTMLTCGSMLVDDGIAEEPIKVRLTRFFSAQSPWMRTSISLENSDPNNSYENSVWFGGEAGVGPEPLLEAYGQQVTSAQALDSSSRVLIAGSGPRISRSVEEPEGFMSVQIFGKSPNQIYGGAGMESSPFFSQNQIWASTDFFLDAQESKNFSWMQGFVDYDPGCDRLTSLNTWNNSLSFLAQAQSRSLMDGFKLNSQINYPTLLSGDCSSFGAPTYLIEVTSRDERLEFTWNRVPDASAYQVEYQMAGSSEWKDNTQLIYQFDTDTKTSFIPGLETGNEYRVRIRAVQLNRNSAGDIAFGFWNPVSEFVYLAPTLSPSPTPSPSPTIIPLKNQTVPKVPAKLAVKKTVKFAMVTDAKLKLTVKTKGTCKTTKIITKKKVGKKTVTTQTGWLVTATKKGKCTVTLSAPGNKTWKALKATKVITIK